jgi:phospholipase/carboxylesterase
MSGVSAFPAPVAARYGSADPDAPVVVLLHGRGATEASIASLVPELPEGPTYVALRAPIAEGNGFAWFANLGIGRPRPESLADTIDWFRRWLDHDLGPDRPVLLVGYSGGTAFAGGVLLSEPERFAGAALLYGTLPFDAGVPVTPGRLIGIPILLAHGVYDDVIPRELQDRTWEYLHRDSGAPVIARREATGHELSTPTVVLLAQWLGSRLQFMADAAANGATPISITATWPGLDGELPHRTGGRPVVTFAMPQQQDSQNAPPELQEALFGRVTSWPDIETGPSAISVPGARAFNLRSGADRGPDEAFIVRAAREFGHIHPSYDGSMHLTLPEALARDAIAKEWATPHCLAGVQLSPGMVMIYGPRTEEELDIVSTIVRASYDFAVGPR